MRSPVVTFSLLAAAAVSASTQLPDSPIPTPKLTPHMNLDTLKFLPGTPQAEGDFRLHTERRQLAPAGLGIVGVPSSESDVNDATYHDKRAPRVHSGYHGVYHGDNGQVAAAEAEHEAQAASAIAGHDGQVASSVDDHDAAERARAGDYPYGYTSTQQAGIPGDADDSSVDDGDIDIEGPASIMNPILDDGLDGGSTFSEPAIGLVGDGPVVSSNSGDANGISVMNGHIFQDRYTAEPGSASNNGLVDAVPAAGTMPSFVVDATQERQIRRPGAAVSRPIRGFQTRDPTRGIVQSYGHDA
ncbi:hypothetical protein CERSUDRAFT_90251 [Gelatoporia subvermispora B]|uniref:Uncharacterized protein n=1 Tax=Ceriporiopsis subvermispora (strain B) TaxID=914234 RepID=M2PXP7_CERS8|nr:hypothetical protein CERSUDRAFT_90251 [Gelatoporia subvermispora B]